jgi:hypothetical protein
MLTHGKNNPQFIKLRIATNKKSILVIENIHYSLDLLRCKNFIDGM